MALSSPPAPFPAFNVTTLPAGAQLVRLHDPTYQGDQFNPCAGSPSRFSPLKQPDGTCLPTLYAADRFEAAVHESIFHDQPYGHARKYVSIDKIVSRAVSEIAVTADLTLAQLHQADLMLLGLSRSDLIDTDATHYVLTARWAEAFHRANSTISGLVWTSRRCDPDQAYVLFADRVPKTALTVKKTTLVSTSSALLLEIRGFAKRAGITITL